MSKFNIKEALHNQIKTGNPCVETRSGKKVAMITYCPESNTLKFTTTEKDCIGIVNAKTGFARPCALSDHDLFMTAKEIKDSKILASEEYLFSMVNSMFNHARFNKVV